MKLNLSSTFTRNLVSKILSKIIRNKLGYDVDVLINDLNIETINGDVKATLQLEAKIDQEDFSKLVRQNLKL